MFFLKEGFEQEWKSLDGPEIRSSFCCGDSSFLLSLMNSVLASLSLSILVITLVHPSLYSVQMVRILKFCLWPCLAHTDTSGYSDGWGERTQGQTLATQWDEGSKASKIKRSELGAGAETSNAHGSGVSLYFTGSLFASRALIQENHASESKTTTKSSVSEILKMSLRLLRIQIADC